MTNEFFDTVVIGGGAAGICAAISKARTRKSVVICEKLPQLGKKILATGNGRCNLINDRFDETFYNTSSREIVRSVFSKFGKMEILDFFHDLGLETFSQDGRIFPVTNQAASVLKVLEIEINRLKIPVKYEFTCTGLTFSGKSIIVEGQNGQIINAGNVILTGGGKSYPVLGSDGSVLELAQRLGHTIIEPVPSAVPLVIKDPLCHSLQGQRIQAGACSVIDHIKSAETKGELLFTKYGLSGTCILDISENISIALNRQHKKEIFAAIDLIPFMKKDQLKNILEKRDNAHTPADEMLVGILPNKISAGLSNLFEHGCIDSAVNNLKDYRFKVSATKSWDEAEFTTGGINPSEINPSTLESHLHKGLYFAGEILDVNGKRGGYNLGWAWASGLLVGQTL